MDNLDFEALGRAAWTWITTDGSAIVSVIVTLFLAWVVAGFAKRMMLRAFARANFDATLSKFFSNMARYAILAGAVLGCLGVFGVDTTSFAAVIGAAGLAIGLAFQGTLSNFAAGVMLLVFRPFKVDDFVEIGGKQGTVKEIELFTTELASPNNIKIILPNSQVFGNVIENFTHHGFRRADVAVGCDYSADIPETRAILERAIANLENARAEPPPQVVLTGLGASSVDWQLRAFGDNAVYLALQEEMITAVKRELDAAGVGIPFPQMDVHLDGGDKAA